MATNDSKMIAMTDTNMIIFLCMIYNEQSSNKNVQYKIQISDIS